MARQCQLTGKRTGFGNSISHSHRKTRRKFKINLVSKKIYLAHENRWVSLKISARALRTLSKKGAVAIMKKNGQDTRLLKKK